MNGDIEHLKLEAEDREGQLIELQQEGAAVQASMNAIPGANTPPGLRVPNGHTIGQCADAGAGQGTADEWLANRVEEYTRSISEINAGAPKFGAQHFDMADTPPKKSPEDGGSQNNGAFPARYQTFHSPKCLVQE